MFEANKNMNKTQKHVWSKPRCYICRKILDVGNSQKTKKKF